MGKIRRFFFVVVFLVPSLETGQDPVKDDSFKEIQAKIIVANERTESLFRDRLREFDEWFRRDPQRAMNALDMAGKLIENDSTLNEKRKLVLKEQLGKKILVSKNGMTQDAELSSGFKMKSLVATPGQESNILAQQQKIARELREVNNLRGSGRQVDADKRLGELAKQQHDNLAINAASKISGTSGLIREANTQRSRMGNSMIGAFKEVEVAGIPIVGDIVFPDDWAEKSKRRSSGARMTAKERSILTGLSNPMSITLDGEPLKYFLEKMEKQLGLPLVVDRQALDTAGVNLESPITIRASNWSSRSVLKKVLADLGLSYIIKSEEVQITTQDTARETMVTRSYYIGDLLPNFGTSLAGLNNAYIDPYTKWNMANSAQMQYSQTLVGIIDSIKSQVDPNSWAPNGQGGIVFEPLSMSLIVKQTAEVHFMLGSTLR